MEHVKSIRLFSICFSLSLYFFLLLFNELNVPPFQLKTERIYPPLIAIFVEEFLAARTNRISNARIIFLFHFKRESF